MQTHLNVQSIRQYEVYSDNSRYKYNAITFDKRMVVQNKEHVECNLMWKTS